MVTRFAGFRCEPSTLQNVGGIVLLFSVVAVFYLLNVHVFNKIKSKVLRLILIPLSAFVLYVLLAVGGLLFFCA